MKEVAFVYTSWQHTSLGNMNEVLSRLEGPSQIPHVGIKLAELLKTEQVTGSALLTILKRHPLLSYWYGRPIGGVDGMTLEEHTERVIAAYERYFEADAEILFKRQIFKLLLALHDIGKPRAVEEAKLEKQYEYTSYILSSISPDIDIAPEILTPIIAVITADPIGRHLNKKFLAPVEHSLHQIDTMAHILSVSVADLWPTLLVYYQCDVLGYESLKNKVLVTDDEGDPLYSSKTGRFQFKDPAELERFTLLEQRVLDPLRTASSSLNTLE